jgi:predicted PhzF superfamily epimerase YddE/YHI9
MNYTFQIVGVFRSAPFGGNQLAVRYTPMVL